MISDTERREVAARLREYVDIPDDWWQETCAEFYVEKCVFGNVDRHSEAELFTRLAGLIDPGDSGDPIEEIKKWCLSAMEGADGALDTMLCEIVGAIEEYQHPELAMAETERAVNRDALLALAEEINDTSCDNHGELSVSLGDIWGWAQAIRDALGVE